MNLMLYVLFVSLAFLHLACIKKQVESDLFGGKENGGAFLLSDDVNPWFIQNTSVVSYCITIDQQNFGVPLAQAKSSFLKAVQYWKEQFSRANRYTEIEDRGYIRLGEFEIKEDCNTPQVELKLGILEGDKIGKLTRPVNAVLAETVRLAYDDLVGRGFIYLSPERGALAPKTSVTDRWTRFNGKFLDSVLIHEVGHLFRLEHIRMTHDHLLEMFSSEFYNEVLEFIDQIDRHHNLSSIRDWKVYLDSLLEPRDYFREENKPYFYRTCWPQGEDTSPLELKRAYHCLAVFMGGGVSIAGSDSPNGPWELIGESTQVSSSYSHLPWTHMVIGEKFLNPEVFDVEGVKEFARYNQKSGEYVLDVYPTYNRVGTISIDLKLKDGKQLKLYGTEENGKFILNYADPGDGLTTVFAGNFWKQIGKFPEWK